MCLAFESTILPLSKNEPKSYNFLTNSDILHWFVENDFFSSKQSTYLQSCYSLAFISTDTFFRINDGLHSFFHHSTGHFINETHQSTTWSGISITTAGDDEIKQSETFLDAIPTLQTLAPNLWQNFTDSISFFNKRGRYNSRGWIGILAPEIVRKKYVGGFLMHFHHFFFLLKSEKRPICGITFALLVPSINIYSLCTLSTTIKRKIFF